MNKKSALICPETATDISPETLNSLYVTMLRIRRVEERVAELVGAGGR